MLLIPREASLRSIASQTVSRASVVEFVNIFYGLWRGLGSHARSKGPHGSVFTSRLRENILRLAWHAIARLVRALLRVLCRGFLSSRAFHE